MITSERRIDQKSDHDHNSHVTDTPSQITTPTHGKRKNWRHLPRLTYTATPGHLLTQPHEPSPPARALKLQLFIIQIQIKYDKMTSSAEPGQHLRVLHTGSHNNTYVATAAAAAATQRAGPSTTCTNFIHAWPWDVRGPFKCIQTRLMLSSLAPAASQSGEKDNVAESKPQSASNKRCTSTNTQLCVAMSQVLVRSSESRGHMLHAPYPPNIT